MRDIHDKQIFESIDDLSEILVLVEPGLGKGAGFGDPDFIIRFRLGRKRYLIYFQVKIESYRQSRNRKNTSSISSQLVLSDKFAARFAEISAEELRKNGIETERKKLKDRFVIGRVLIERLWDYRADYFSGCVTADPASPLPSSGLNEDRFCWLGLHELYRIAKDSGVTAYLEAADFNRDRRVFSGPADLADLQAGTMYPAAGESYNILIRSLEKFIDENDKALCLNLNRRSLSIKCPRCSGKVLLTLTPRVNTLTGDLQWRRKCLNSGCSHGGADLVDSFLERLEKKILFEF